MIKAVFFDIDGTLVSFKTHRIPTTAIEAIQRIRKMGVKVFIATGRPMPFINNLDGLEYDGVMSVNGACCVTSTGEVITRHTVPEEDIRRMVEDAASNPIPVAFASNERAIVANPEAAKEHLQEVFELLNITIPETHPIEEALKMDVLQVIAFFTEQEEPRIMGEVLQGCDANRWHPYFADCVVKGCNKATGIDDICRYYGIKREETVAFGDGGNDITMLRHAGVGVAMGSAPDEVKAAADMITASVDDDGIEKALTSLFFSFEI